MENGKHLIGIYVDQEFMADYLFLGKESKLSFFANQDLPKETRVVSVSYDMSRWGFLFVLEHPSFPEHYPGQAIEIHHFDYGIVENK